MVRAGLGPDLNSGRGLACGLFEVAVIVRQALQEHHVCLLSATVT